MSCDDVIAKFMTLNERAEYASLITRHATYGNQQIAWANNFSKGGSYMKKRMVNIMGKNKKIKIRGLISVLVICFVIVLNSFSVFAYKDVRYFNLQSIEMLASESSDTEIKYQFTSIEEAEGFGWKEGNPVVMYDKQFIDVHGNIHDMTNPVKTYAICSHNYQDGIYQQHKRYTDGNCSLDSYNAKVCINCGSIDLKEKISSTTFYSCPH